MNTKRSEQSPTGETDGEGNDFSQFISAEDPGETAHLNSGSQQRDVDSPEWADDSVKAPLRYAAPLGGQKGAALQSLPVIFVFSLVTIIVGVYLGFHIIPLLQRHNSSDDAFSRGIGELAAFAVLLVLFVTCFSLSVIIKPGTPVESGESIIETSSEIKSSGGLRVCKWCAVLKPDRSHHCRVCRNCVLRMDHHCPWLANCVGWGNHKYFMLLLLYGNLTCLFVAATMMESVVKVIAQPEAEFWHLFALLFGVTLDLLLLLVLSIFGSFHLYLLTKGMTTIEFCEKRFRRSDMQPPSDMWNLGFWHNFNETFGYNPFVWFLPIDNRSGDGKHFISGLQGFGRAGSLEPAVSFQIRQSKTAH